MPQPRLSPERGHTLCASWRSRNTCQDFTRVTLCRNLHGKCRGQLDPTSGTRTSCEPAQSKCTSAFHKRQKSHFILKFSGKMPQPRLSPERGHTFCASLRSRNACQNFTRATLYENLRVKCRRPE